MSVDVGISVASLPEPEVTVDKLTSPEITVQAPGPVEIAVDTTSLTLEFSMPDVNVIEVGVIGGGGSGGEGGPEEVALHKDPPLYGYDLWVDLDAPVFPTTDLPIGYEHAQTMLSVDWVVVHNLGRKPVVHTRDAVDHVMFGSVRHDSNNQLTVHFQNAITGKAYCT